MIQQIKMPAIFSWQAFLTAAAPQPNVGALKMMKGASYEKPNNRAGARWKCTPIPAYGGTFPEGEVCSPLTLVLT